METRRRFYYGKFVLFGIAGLILFTFVVKWLWNWLVPELFSGPEINYWQTLGLLILSKIIFSGIGKGHAPGERSRQPREWSHYQRDKWRKKFEEKMNGRGEQKEDGGGPVVTE